MFAIGKLPRKLRSIEVPMVRTSSHTPTLTILNTKRTHFFVCIFVVVDLLCSLIPLHKIQVQESMNGDYKSNNVKNGGSTGDFLTKDTLICMFCSLFCQHLNKV